MKIRTYSIQKTLICQYNFHNLIKKYNIFTFKKLMFFVIDNKNCEFINQTKIY